jgi:hypothetical protein
MTDLRKVYRAQSRSIWVYQVGCGT